MIHRAWLLDQHYQLRSSIVKSINSTVVQSSANIFVSLSLLPLFAIFFFVYVRSQNSRSYSSPQIDACIGGTNEQPREQTHGPNHTHIRRKCVVHSTHTHTHITAARLTSKKRNKLRRKRKKCATLIYKPSHSCTCDLRQRIARHTHTHAHISHIFCLLVARKNVLSQFASTQWFEFFSLIIASVCLPIALLFPVVISFSLFANNCQNVYIQWKSATKEGENIKQLLGDFFLSHFKTEIPSSTLTFFAFFFVSF